MRRLFALLFSRGLVYTEDHDGEFRLRLVRESPFGGYLVAGILSCTMGTLSSRGRITNGHYLRYWKPANDKAGLIWTKLNAE